MPTEPPRRAAAEVDFWFAYDMSIVWGGLFADELIDGTGFDNVDQRFVSAADGTIGAGDGNPEGFDGLWTPMQRASVTSNLLQDEIGAGPELGSQEVYALAEEDFTAAIEAASATDAVRNAALVGRARARLFRGDFDAAVGDAQQVPLTFEFVGDVFSTNRQKEENDIWNMITDSQRFSVGPRYRGLTVDGTATEDPRVPVFQDPDDRFTSDGTTELFQTEKCNVPTCPLRLASGFEAAYIIAEVEGGQTAGDLINDVRAAQGIDEEFSSSDPDEIFRKLIDEKRRTLFLEGQRQGMLRRLQEQRDPSTLPPIARFPQDDQGDRVCFALPDAERDNNPDI